MFFDDLSSSYLTASYNRSISIHPDYREAVERFRQQQAPGSAPASSPQTDSTCPICLSEATLPVDTTCGHQNRFCGTCLLQYHEMGVGGHTSLGLGPMRCPLCRRRVNLLLPCFDTNRAPTDPGERERFTRVVSGIRSYNRRYSNEPRTVRCEN